VTVAGSGSPEVPYTVGVAIDPSLGNTLECRAGGLFVPEDGQLEFGCLLNDTGTVAVLAPATIGNPSRAEAVYNDACGVSPNVIAYTTLAPGGTIPQAHFEIQPGGEGLYAAQISVSGWTAGPAAAGDVILRAGLGRQVAGGAYSLAGVPVYTTVAAPFNTPAIVTTMMVQLGAFDRVWVEVAVEDYSGPFAGATLVWGPVYDLLETSGQTFEIWRVAR